jgi:hypothetical protein
MGKTILCPGCRNKLSISRVIRKYYWDDVADEWHRETKCPDCLTIIFDYVVEA